MECKGVVSCQCSRNKFSHHVPSRFRWVFCQLETLRRSVQRNLRGILEKLPKTLDETYERVLKNINEDNREHARRLLHCLAFAIRPLRVEELAEILAFDFDDIQGGIPKFHTGWRWKDQEEAVLSTCSSLIAVVYSSGSRVVQFSHFSVKEFLVSDRLASSTPDVSRYHILPGPAHTILAQVCLGFLLHSDDHIDRESVCGFPLARYAAEHWVAHAQFEDVASRVEDGMRSLFDPSKLHLVTWLDIYDIGQDEDELEPATPNPNPLYYASLYGFHDLVEHLVLNHPQLVNVVYGELDFPLLAALCNKHIQIAEFLLRHGGTVDIRGWNERTPLHIAIADCRRVDTVETDAVSFLLNHGADVNSRDDHLCTPLHLAAECQLLEVARMLLDRGADIDSRDDSGRTPLHVVFELKFQYYRRHDLQILIASVTRLLLERGADVNARDKYHRTPLILAIQGQMYDAVRILLVRGAEPNVRDDRGKTPLHLLLAHNFTDKDNILSLVRLLLECGAEVDAQDQNHATPLLLAAGRHLFDIARILLRCSAELNVKNIRGKTPLHLLLERYTHHYYDVNDVNDFLVADRLSLDRRLDVNAQDEDNTTVLYPAFNHRGLEISSIINEHTDVEKEPHQAQMHITPKGEYNSLDHSAGISQLSLERGAEVNTQNMDPITRLHWACYFGKLEMAIELLNDGAYVNAENTGGETPLHIASRGQYDSQENGIGIVQLLLGHGANVNAQDKGHITPLHLASYYGKLDIVLVLLYYDASINMKGELGQTPLHLALDGNRSGQDALGIVRLLLEHGADVNSQDNDNITPLHLSSKHGKLAVGRVLLNRGANANATNIHGQTPLHMLSLWPCHVEDECLLVEILVYSGADVNARDNDNETPLHTAYRNNRLDIADRLIEEGADEGALNTKGKTPFQLTPRLTVTE